MTGRSNSPRDPRGWRQQLATALYALAVSARVYALAGAGHSSR
ncbi:hypothetical protein [Streptomyces goshikiensis]